MNDYNKEFGKRITDARKNLDITMKELGKLVDLHVYMAYPDGVEPPTFWD